MPRLSRVITFSLSLVLVLLSFNVHEVYAQEASQRQVLDSGILFFDVERTQEPCGGNVNLVGSNNAEQIFNFFVAKGMQPYQAAGIMGNMQAESGLNPRRVQSTPTPSGDRDNITVDGKTGYGLVQWTSQGRQQGLADFAKAQGANSGDLGIQLQYVMIELEGGYRGSSYEPLLASKTVDEATEVILTNYERPADIPGQRPGRLKFARDILARFGSGGGSTGSDSIACGSGSSGEIIGGFSLPLDKKWYNRKEFTDPHHSGYAAIDIQVPQGTPVYSMTAGKVIDAPNGTATKGFGLGVTIDAGNGVIFYYGHGSDGGSVVGAKKGDTVEAGQLIMHSASTGNSTGPHLHVEIRIDDERHCPQNLLVAIGEGTTIPGLGDLPTKGCTYTGGAGD